MTDQTKAEAAAYAPEIELLTRAIHYSQTQAPEVRNELQRRLRILLGLEEGETR